VATLQTYNIEVDTTRVLPSELQDHIDVVLKHLRVGHRSPNAKRIVGTRRAASYDNESTGIRKVEPLLLIAGEDDPLTLFGVPKLTKKLNLNLARSFLPPPPPGKALLPLSQPQPDTAIGYLTTNMAKSSQPPLDTAFSQREEEILSNFTLNPALMFPFLTSQWKPATGESHLIAHSQSARDGATIINYLEQFYTIAYGRPPTVLECAHLSVTCDIQVVDVWIHWRELHEDRVPTYYMQNIHSCTLRDEQGLLDTRRILWNHVDYALGDRLASLKEVLPLFQHNYTKIKGRGKSSASVLSNEMKAFPPTPVSNQPDADPVKRDNKRRRLNSQSAGAGEAGQESGQEAGPGDMG
jgi:hypothetical protein